MRPTRPKRIRKRSLVPPSTRRLEELFLLGSYPPFGKVTSDGDVEQPIQWSSEMYDPELALIYYKTPDGCKGGWTCVSRHAPEGRGAVRRLRVNYRYYNPTDGRWTRRDPVRILQGINLHSFLMAQIVDSMDYLGLKSWWPLSQESPNIPTII